MEKGKKEKNEGRKNKSRLDKIPLERNPLGTESKKDESEDGVEEIFGVHVLGDKDNEKHFGASPEGDSADSSDQKIKNE